MGQANARRVEFDKDGHPSCGIPPTLFESTDAYNAIIESYKIMSRYTHEHTGHVYLPSEYPYNRSTISFDNGTRTLTHTIKSPHTSFEFFLENEFFSKDSAQTVQITDTEGLWFFFYDSAGVLQASQTPWTWDNVVFTALVYWDSTNKKQILLGEERHGLSMSWATHRRFHLVDGMAKEKTPGALIIQNATLDGDGSSNTHAQFGVTDGDLLDEDIIHPVRHAASPANPFEQILDPYVYAPVFYLSGANAWIRRKDPTQFPFYENASARPSFNYWNGSSWGLQQVQNGWFFATWLIYTNGLNYPVAVLLGQREDGNLIDAVNNNTRLSLETSQLPSNEVIFYRKLIWETSDSFTNTPKCRLRYIAEATEINPANDRYAIPFQYIGNAGTGKWLETFTGSSSDESPFTAPEESFIRTITLRSTANSTGVMGVFRLPNTTTPIFTLTFSNQMYLRQDLAFPLAQDDLIAVKVVSGSFNKPTMRMFIQTNL